MNDFTVIILSAFGGGVGACLGAYIKEKGKNLATKEDIADITDQVEGVKQAYHQDLETLKNELARTLVVSQQQIEKEISVYYELCELLGEIRAEYYRVMPGYRGIDPPNAERQEDFRAFNRKLMSLQVLLDQRSPFYSPKIKEKAFKIMNVASERSTDGMLAEGQRMTGFWGKEDQVRKVFFGLHEELYELVRLRIEELKMPPVQQVNEMSLKLEA
ncbi:MAG: hypothetical protein CML13_15445 [Puniceicoccaceae bacterium]|nr:hypothetical protein [Puniceicoccaceae bacterium]|tara:strand:- start:7108 stop:7755 length:648 start_codon:yes stop_codon:yes gene_type:complete